MTCIVSFVIIFCFRKNVVYPNSSTRLSSWRGNYKFHSLGEICGLCEAKSNYESQASGDDLRKKYRCLSMPLELLVEALIRHVLHPGKYTPGT